MDPGVSLIIPAYNRERFVAAAIGSVRRQTYADFELIVWDDGSTDRTVEVAEQAAQGDARVRVLRAEHRGVAAALNAAAREAKGRYLGWVDSDDAIAPTALEKTAAVLDARPEVGFVYTQHVEMDEAGWVGDVGRRCLVPYSKERLLIDFMTFQFRLLRREIFERVGGLDESLPSAEDYDLCLRLAEMTEVAHVAEPLYLYRVHGESSSTSQRVAQILAARDAIARALARRGLDGEYEIHFEIVGRYELRRRKRNT